MIFYCGQSRYKQVPPAGSVLGRAMQIVWEAIWVNRRAVGGEEEQTAQHMTAHDSTERAVAAKITYAGDACACVSWSCHVMNMSHVVGTHWLDRARMSLGGTYEDSVVQDVKYVARLIPFLLCLIMYWGIYSQVSSMRDRAGVSACLACHHVITYSVTSSCMSIVSRAPRYHECMPPLTDVDNLLQPRLSTRSPSRFVRHARIRSQPVRYCHHRTHHTGV